MTAQNSFFGNVIGSANEPNFTTGSGVWRPTDIARRLQFSPTVYNDGAWPLLPDANFSSVTVLAHFDTNGAITSSHQTVPNTGSIGGTLLLQGCGLSNAQSKFAPFSLLCDATRQNTTQNGATVGSNAGLSFGTGDLTIEFWVYFNSFAVGQNIYDCRTVANSVCPVIYTQTDNSLRYFVSNVDRINSGASALGTSQWYHIAVARTSTSTKMFINGTQTGSTFTDSNNYISSGLTFGGAQGSISATASNGYYAELRVTKGFCRYTTTFTPPTSRFPDY